MTIFRIRVPISTYQEYEVDLVGDHVTANNAICALENHLEHISVSGETVRPILGGPTDMGDTRDWRVIKCLRMATAAEENKLVDEARAFQKANGLKVEPNRALVEYMANQKGLTNDAANVGKPMGSF